MNVHLSREDELTGTAGGVKRLEKNFDDTFVVIMGDALTDIDIRELIAFHKEKGALATIALKRVYETSEYGVVELDPEGNILGFQEKPDPEEAISNLANTGIYVFEPRVLEYIPKDTFFDFAKDVFPRLLEAGERFVGCEGEFYWSDIGTLQAYREAHHAVLSGQVGVTVPGERRGESFWVGEDARIHSSARLDGSVAVGRDAVIGEDVALAEDVTVGTGCQVHTGATIKRSILLPGASVGDQAYLEDCIVGYDYYVRPGERISGGTLTGGQTYVPEKTEWTPNLSAEALTLAS
jgi:NDP-sugar pyrophosphorylase family protein